MPHYLIHGADKNTAKNRVVVFHCQNEDQASNNASEAEIFIASIESLDKDEKPRRNDGTSGGLLRMATKLNQQHRYEEAISILLQALKMAQSEGVEYGFDTYLRLPRYLMLSGNNDRAWGAFNMLKLGQIEGVGPINLMPANLADLYNRMTELCQDEHMMLLKSLSSICYLISETLIGRCKPQDAVHAIERTLTESPVQFNNPIACAASFTNELKVISPPPQREDEFDDMSARCKSALRLAYKADQVIRDAANFK